MPSAKGVSSWYNAQYRVFDDSHALQLRCDVVTEPQFQPCSRCIKHHLHCAIDPGFRRQEKRQQYAELEKELAALKAENAELRAGRLPPTRPGPHPYTAPKASAAAAAASAFPGPNEAAASRSLLDLAQGQNQSHEDSYTSNGNQPTANTLGPVVLSDVELSELFAIFFTRYHPYLPLLSTDISHSAYFNLHPLLHWTIITVASRRYDRRPTLLAELKQPVTDLLSETIFSAPQTYHVVKALCLLCTWPLPTNSTSLDLSMMICGTMVQLAMQFGLHRPSHAQDFSRYKIELREEDIKDRMNTWVACNIVAQKYVINLRPNVSIANAGTASQLATGCLRSHVGTGTRTVSTSKESLPPFAIAVTLSVSSIRSRGRYTLCSAIS